MGTDFHCKRDFCSLLFSFEHVGKKIKSSRELLSSSGSFFTLIIGNYYLPVAPFLHLTLKVQQFALTMQCKIISVSTYNIQQLQFFDLWGIFLYKILPQRILLSCYVDGKHFVMKAYMLYKEG